MKIQIKTYRRGDEVVPVVRGFFPENGLRLKPGEVYECETQEQYERCLATGHVDPAPKDAPVTQSILDRKAILMGDMERDRDLNRTPEQASELSALRDAVLDQSATRAKNEQLEQMVQEMSERLAALETKPKRGRPKKDEEPRTELERN